MTTMTADDLADSISRGEKWKVIGCIGHDCEECQTRIAKDASQQAEPVKPVPAAIVATQSDVWRGYNGQWAPPGEPIKMVQMLRDLPMGTLLYTALAQQDESETCTWCQDGDSDSGVYATSCGHYFNLTDGTPEDNKMQWCCYCGKRLVQELITEDGDE